MKGEGDRKEKLGSRENSGILRVWELGDMVPFSSGALYVSLEILELVIPNV